MHRVDHSFNQYILLLLTLSLLWVSCQQTQPKGVKEIAQKPEENRFTKVVLAENLDEPMQFDMMKDGRVLFVERRGKVKVLDPATGQIRVIADIPVSIGYYSETGEVLEPTGEDGLQGAVVDPNFDQNHFIYLYYSPKSINAGSILARYEWRGDSLNLDSKKILLEIPNQRISCCHLGGGMVFDANGNLLLSTGDNTPNDPRGYAPLDESPERSRFDSQRSSSNTNDLRGKILRIHPEADGTYTIPKGNLFPEGTPNTRPEIYTMGNRNPWRLSIDSKTGWLYWGEVGPGGTTDSVGMGPRSYDEFNQARKAGNFGWPYFLADNKPYWEYDYVTNKSDSTFNPAHPVNNSANNTGIPDLPPAQPAFIWYPQSKAIDFPLLGSGSNSAVGGPIYHQSDFKNAKRPFPAYYEGKWFITDWTRGWIMAVSLDENGAFQAMKQFLPGLDLKGPIDMKFGLDGDLYIMEYGRGPYKRNAEAKLVRIEYNAGNRKPIVIASADKKAGAVPLHVQLSSEGTIDYDKDLLTYTWKITSAGKPIQTFKQANPVITLAEPSKYQAILTVRDAAGATDSSSIEIMAGNDPPRVTIDLNGANQSFYFPGNTITYSVQVTDKEDGTLVAQQIPASKVAVNIEYIATDNLTVMKQHLQQVDALVSLQSVLALQLINSSDCKSCHSADTKLVGPAYRVIANKYKGDAAAQTYLVKKIISGGSGVWEAEMAMPPHPAISESEAQTIANYILTINDQQAARSLPVQGTYSTDIPEAERKKPTNYFSLLFTEKFILRASYTDKGTEAAPPQSSLAMVVLRNPVIPVSQADQLEGIELNHEINTSNSSITPKKSGAYLAFKQIDLTNIRQIEFAASAIPGANSTSGGIIEIRIDSPTGKLIGQTEEVKLVKSERGKKLPATAAGIEKTQGIHTVYFLFVNKAPTHANSQMQIRNVRFIP